MRKNVIDISTEKKKKEIFDLLNGFKTKSEAHEYFGISDNTSGSKYLSEIATEVGFDLSEYAKRRKKPTKYCKECGKEMTNKYGNMFCSNSCAAKYNNKLRKRTVKSEGDVSKSITKAERNIVKKESVTYTKTCAFCGKIFQTKSKNAVFCSGKCASLKSHEVAYRDFLENPEKFCKGNYTPKAFKGEFLEEQGGVCAICGCKPFHNDKPLVFVLDHIDGDASNNRRENLRMVCPNCDSQLPTFKSKNKNSTRRNYWKENIIKHLNI